MDLKIASDGNCGSCPRLSILTDSCKLAIGRFDDIDKIAELETRLESIADGVCEGCTKEEPVARYEDEEDFYEDTIVVSLFPGKQSQAA